MARPSEGGFGGSEKVDSALFGAEIVGKLDCQAVSSGDRRADKGKKRNLGLHDTREMRRVAKEQGMEFFPSFWLTKNGVLGKGEAVRPEPGRGTQNCTL